MAFSAGQVAAVRAAFALAGYGGEIRTLAVDSDDERLFVVEQDRLLAMDVRSLEQVLTQVLGLKVWVLDGQGSPTFPFG